MKKMLMTFVAVKVTSQQNIRQTNYTQNINNTENNHFSNNFMNTQGLKTTGCSSCSRRK